MPLSRHPQLDPSDIRLLRVFAKVVECGGFTPAQAELNVSASTISTQIATLESRLGMRLCQRGRVGFRLTDKGRKVYAASLHLFEALEGFRADVGALRGKLVGELHLATVDNTVTNREARLPEAIARFVARDHTVHVTVHVAEPTTLERGLLDGKYDLGIAAYYHHVPGLVYEPLYSEHHALYCGQDHPLFAGAPDAVTLADIENADYVARGYLGHRLATPAARLKSAATAYDMEAIAMLVLSGAFIGHLPSHYAAQWRERDTMRPLLPEHFDYRSHFEVATRKGVARTRVLDAFLTDLRTVHGGASAPERGATALGVAD